MTLIEKHPTPWIVEPEELYFLLFDADGNVVLDDAEGDLLEMIATRVNACAGLEHPENLGELFRAINDLEQDCPLTILHAYHALKGGQP